MSPEMSSPATTQEKPVGTQERSAGETNGVTEPFKAALKEAIADMFAVTAWQPKEIVKFVIECPSGQKVLAKHLDTMDLIGADLVEELDLFTKKLFPQNLDAQGNPVESTDDEDSTIWTVLRDIEKRSRFFTLLNKLLVIGVVKPRVIDDGIAVIERNGKQELVFGAQLKPEYQIKFLGHEVPKTQEGEVYASAVDFTDKMTIFAELNKPLGMIQPFREESNAVLASMEPSEIAGGPSE